MTNKAKRAEFFAGYKLIIDDLIDHGFYEAAENQIDSRDEMEAHFAKFGRG
ncbi:hypothetical protein GOL31_23465 [Sinorhizobium medicae]|nr:hypothetical protein [Sinorhizobium medicae]